MPIGPLNDVDIEVNGVDLSDHGNTCVVSQEAEDLDVTAFGATARAHRNGLRDDMIQVTFYQNHDAGEVDPTLAPLLGANTGFTVVVKPTSGTVAADNPSYTATMILRTYSAINGGVGEISTTEAEFILYSGSIVRAVT